MKLARQCVGRASAQRNDRRGLWHRGGVALLMALTLGLGLTACDGDDGGTPAGDGGMAQGDAGPMRDLGLNCAPGTVTVQQNCPAFSACGGSLTGSYCYTNLCLSTADLSITTFGTCDLSALDPSSLTGTVNGGAVFTADQVNRVAKVELSGTLSLPATSGCSLGSCSTIQNLLNVAIQSRGATATCTARTTSPQLGCDCALSIVQNVDQMEGFTASGNTITTASGRTYDYCISGSTLGLTETTTTSNLTPEPGNQTLTAQ